MGGRDTDFQKLFSVTEQINLKPLLAHYSLKMISKVGITVVLYIDDNILKTTLSQMGENIMDEFKQGDLYKKTKEQKCGN